MVELPVEVHRLARPQGTEHLEGLIQTPDTSPGRLLVDSERVELGGDRSPAQAEVEPPAARLVDRRPLLGQGPRGGPPPPPGGGQPARRSPGRSTPPAWPGPPGDGRRRIGRDDPCAAARS